LIWAIYDLFKNDESGHGIQWVLVSGIVSVFEVTKRYLIRRDDKKKIDRN